MPHFIKDNILRVIYSLLLQILSATVAKMMKAAVDKDSVKVGSICNKKMPITMISFIVKWNHSVGIMNNWDGVLYSREW